MLPQAFTGEPNRSGWSQNSGHSDGRRNRRRNRRLAECNRRHRWGDTFFRLEISLSQSINFKLVFLNFEFGSELANTKQNGKHVRLWKEIFHSFDFQMENLTKPIQRIETDRIGQNYVFSESHCHVVLKVCCLLLGNKLGRWNLPTLAY